MKNDDEKNDADSGDRRVRGGDVGRLQEGGRSGPAPAAGAVRVTELDLGRSLAADKGIADKTTDFRPTDTIYLSVETDGSVVTGDARDEVDLPGRPGRQGVDREHRAFRQGAHRVPHREARRLAGRQVRGRGVAERRRGRQQGLRGQVISGRRDASCCGGRGTRNANMGSTALATIQTSGNSASADSTSRRS